MSFFRESFGLNPFRSTAPEYYKWKISENPSMQGFTHLEMRDGNTAGSATLTPKRLSVMGEELLGTEIGDTFTHIGYRRQGIFTRCVCECTDYAISVGLQVIYGTPNSESLPGYEKKLGYPRCPFANVRKMIKHTSVRSIEKAMSSRLGWHPRPRILARILLWYFSARIKRLEERRSFDIVPVDRFAVGIDGLWGRSRTDYCFFTVRDESYLNWRFFENPDRYEVYAAIEDDRYLGYVATKLFTSEDMVVGTICDFVTSNDRVDVFADLINEVESKFKEWGVEYIQVWCVEGSPYFWHLARSGYLKRAEIPVIVFASTEIGKQLVQMKGIWHFTMADSDNI